MRLVGNDGFLRVDRQQWEDFPMELVLETLSAIVLEAVCERTKASGWRFLTSGRTA